MYLNYDFHAVGLNITLSNSSFPHIKKINKKKVIIGKSDCIVFHPKLVEC